jgi:hypothetical protein
MTKEEIIASFATVDENGNVTDFNFDDFDQLVKDLVTARKNMRADAKEAKKAKQAEENENKAEVGKKYYDSLQAGDEFKYVASDGTVVTARKITTKSNSGLSAACEVVAGIEVKKSAKRYPKFYQVIVPTTAA